MLAWLMGQASISTKVLQQLLERDSPVAVIDVNTRASWLKARVPGALHMDPEHLDIHRLPAAQQTTLVFYCSNPMCRKAPSAARRAKQLGYLQVFVLSAGIRGWLEAGLPVEAGECAGEQVASAG